MTKRERAAARALARSQSNQPEKPAGAVERRGAQHQGEVEPGGARSEPRHSTAARERPKRKRARRRSILLPFAERKQLGAAEREEILDERCPECGGVAVGKGGRWRCVAKTRKLFDRKIDPGARRVRRDRGSALRILRCGARGTIIDGRLAVTEGGLVAAEKRRVAAAIEKEESDG